MALNGQVLTTPAVNVQPDDILTVDGEMIDAAEPTRLFRYHKPVDLLTTHKDPQGRPTVFDALPPGLPRLISVGRLDINSEGLLLLTNDGELARALEQPSSEIVRLYRVRARGRATQASLDKLKSGITVEGVRYGPIDAKIDKAKDGPSGANVWITVTLAEGKNREVRKVLKAIGLEVGRLIRMSYGPFALGTLPIGQIEEVGPRVIREQLAEYIAPENMPTGERPAFKSPKAPPGAHAVHDGTGRRGGGAKSDTDEPKKKAEYKAGWARPKVEIKPGTVKRRRAPRPDEEAPAVPLAPRRRSSRLSTESGIRTYAPGDPLAPPRPAAPGRSGPPKKGGKPGMGERRSSGPRTDRPDRKFDKPRAGGDGERRYDKPRGDDRGERSHSKGATLIERGPRANDGKPAKRAYGPRPEGRPGDGPRSGPPRSGPPRSGAPRSGPPRSGPRSDGPRSDGERPRYEGRSEGPRSGPPRSPRPDGPRADGERPRYEGRSEGPRSGPPRSPRPDSARSDGPRSDGPRSDGPRGPRAQGDRPRYEGRSEGRPPPRSGERPYSGPPKGPRGGSGPRPGPKPGPRGPKRGD